MTREKGACLVCGKQIAYFEKSEEMECMICHEKFSSHASCEDGHYICDDCHARKGIEIIIEECGKSVSRNPIELMQKIMDNPYIYMHGPEHHVMAGAVLLTAYYNSGGAIDLVQALNEMKSRGNEYPGGSCGFWGCCGAAVSTGMCMSIITKATPLTGESWRLSNQMTSRALAAIAELGGPRCCKRNSFTAVREAVRFMNQTLSAKMELPDNIYCGFSRENEQCLQVHCPYFQVQKAIELSIKQRVYDK